MEDQTNDQAQTPIDFLKSAWTALFAIAGLLFGVAAGILIPVPANDADSVANLSRYVVAVVVGLVAVATIRFQDHRYTRAWTTTTIVTLSLVLVGFAIYLVLKSNWTSSCGLQSPLSKQSMVVGSSSDLTTLGRQAFKNAKNALDADPTNAELIQGAFGRRYDIWNPKVTTERTFILEGIFLFETILIGVTAVCVAQAVRCAQAKEKTS